MTKRERTLDALVRRTARERWGNNDHGTISPTMNGWVTVGKVPPEFHAHLMDLWRDRHAA